MSTWAELGWGESKQCSVCGWWTRGAPDEDPPDPCGTCGDNIELEERLKIGRFRPKREARP